MEHAGSDNVFPAGEPAHLTYSPGKDPQVATRMRDARQLAVLTLVVFGAAVVFPGLYMLWRYVVPVAWPAHDLLSGTLMLLAGLSGLLAVVYSLYSLLFIPIYWPYIRMLGRRWSILAVCGPLGLLAYLAAVLGLQSVLNKP